MAILNYGSYYSYRRAGDKSSDGDNGVTKKCGLRPKSFDKLKENWHKNDKCFEHRCKENNKI